MKVYFAPCGKGLGHVGRCLPIAKNFEGTNSKVVFSTYQEGTHYVKREKIPVVKSPPVDLQVRRDGTIDFRRTAIHPGPIITFYNLLKQINAEIKAIERFKPDVVVSDSRASSLIAAKILRIPRICILNQFNVIIPRERRFLRLARFADAITLTIIGKIWTSGTKVLIPDFPPPYTISTGTLNIPKNYQKKVKLIGPILATHPHQLASKKEVRTKLDLPQNKIVIFAPISGPLKEKRYLTWKLKDILAKIPERYEVILSLGHPRGTIEPTNYGKVKVYKWIPNRFEYLKACDLVISRAGHGTITQCISYGKPMVLIPTPGHTEQINNAVQVKSFGVAQIIQQEELTREKLLEKIQHAFEDKVLERLKKIQGSVLKHTGVETAVETIIETANKS